MKNESGNYIFLFENVVFSRFDALLRSWYELRSMIEEFVNAQKKRAAQQAIRAKNAAAWSLKASIIHVVLCVIFEALNILFFILIMKEWQK